MEKHQPQRLYFAYGSNLNREQMLVAESAGTNEPEYSGRCPDSECVAPYILEGYRLQFVGERTKRWGRGGVATIVPAAAGRVYGALYRVSQADEELLDGYERVDPQSSSAGNYFKAEDVCRHNGEPAFTYIATAKLVTPNHPNQRYLDTIRRGFKQWGLPLNELDGIATYPAER